MRSVGFTHATNMEASIKLLEYGLTTLLLPDQNETRVDYLTAISILEMFQQVPIIHYAPNAE